MKNLSFHFINRIFTEHEAWGFLQEQGPCICCSIRELANIWQWHRSKVERFIKSMRKQGLIETELKSGKTVIKIIYNKAFDNLSDGVSQEKPETNTQKLSKQDSNIRQIQVICETNKETRFTQENLGLEENSETLLKTKARQTRDNSFLKEEKKKSNKKRKEEIKEKTPLKGGKKEKKNFSDSFDSFDFLDQVNLKQLESNNETQVLKEILSRKSKIEPNSVNAEDVIDWAEKNLPKTIDVEWELEKFKDYHRSRPKKPPKDSVAAFRNWLRRATELQNKNLGGFKHGNNNNKTTRNNDLERFFAGGLRAIDNLSRSRLDWQIDR